MVVNSESAVAAEPPPQPVSKCLIEWKKIHRRLLGSTFEPPPETPWSMVAIRNLSDDGCGDNPPIVFPPINHENLLISTDPPPSRKQFAHILTDNNRISSSDSESDSDSNSSSTFSPSDSSTVPRSPLFLTPAAEPVARCDSWTEFLHSKLSGLARLLCGGVNSSRGVFVTFRSAALVMILVAFLNFRRRRRLRAAEESRTRLIGIIQQRDEKINQLLEQISQMNQRVATNP